MKAVISPMGGFCVLAGDAPECQIVDVLNESEVPIAYAHLICGSCDDWQEIEASDAESLFDTVNDQHALQRAIVNIETCLMGVSTELRFEIFEEVEDYLKTHENRQLKASLLCAPLTSTTDLQEAIGSCLENGQAASAALLEELRETQPLLRRLSDKWLSLPDEHFTLFPEGRQQVWRLAVTAGIILETIHAETHDDAKTKWGLLVFQCQSAAEKASVAGIQTAIAHALFPDGTNALLPLCFEAADDDSEDESKAAPLTGRKARGSYDRMQLQVQAIALAVSEGRDSVAEQYLRELMREQLQYDGGEVHAVKSLCNIAQQCAAMFRTDFEYGCLQKAVELQDKDGWARVQLANHYKRAGRYSEALSELQVAERFGSIRIACSSRADVYVQMGQFNKAIEIYQNASDANENALNRLALADLLRRTGDFAAATQAYDSMVNDGLGSHRVIAGRAEIAKRCERLEEARAHYLGILASSKVERSSVYVYRMAIVNVLVRMQKYLEAYQFADLAVKESPFSGQARIVRATVVGLLGKADTVIDELPVVGQTRAFNEWTSDFVRGMLLLTLDRFADAREKLLQKVEDPLADSDGRGLLQLGAAVCLLRDAADLPRAASVLDEVPAMNDAFADTIRDALRYHVAVRMRDKARMEALAEKLKDVSDSGLRELVGAIKESDWKAVWKLEIQSVLRLAA